MNAAMMKNYERGRELLFKENKQAYDAVNDNNISKMGKIFKNGGIDQGAIDHFIFYVKSVDMMMLFIRYGGDMYKHGPPLYPTPITLLFHFTSLLHDHTADSIERRDLVKLAEFLIEEGADVNAVDELGSSSFWNCAGSGETGLCKFLVERGADPSAKRNDGGTALHVAAGSCQVDVFRYLVEECGLDVNAECHDENMNQRTPLFLAALKGQIDVCTYLLAKGAKVDGGEGAQPLLGAAEVY
jgi:hypothetical protein